MLDTRKRACSLRFSRVVLVAGLIALLASCKGRREEQEITPIADTAATFESADYGFFHPRGLNCYAIEEVATEISEGFTWQGITIGVSSISEVKERLTAIGGIERESSQRHLRFEYTEVNDSTDIPWREVAACFSGDKLVVLQVLAAVEFHLPAEDWLEQYGQPDKVTWSLGYEDRSIIWAEEGILVLAAYHRVPSSDPPFYGHSWNSTHILFFPPIPSSELEGSWLAAGLPTELHGLPSQDESGQAPPVEDPWDIER